MKRQRGRDDRMARKWRRVESGKKGISDRVNGQSKVRDEVEGNQRHWRRVREEEMRQKKTAMGKEERKVSRIMLATCENECCISVLLCVF